MEPEKYYENPLVLQVNRCAARSFFIPYENAGLAETGIFGLPENTDTHKKTDTAVGSERVVSLCKKWAFAYYTSVYRIPDAAVAKNAKLSSFDEIFVPSDIFLSGYCQREDIEGLICPVPIDPPYVPAENPAAVYATDIKLTAADKKFRKYIVFEGAASCLYLYVNGEFAGYSQGAGQTAEFDISELLKTGVNRIAAVTVRYSDGTYTETADNINTTGLFRKVYILKRPSGHLRDFTVKTRLAQNYLSAALDIFIDTEKPADARLTLFDPQGVNLGKYAPDFNGNCTVEIASPEMWSAENPALYTLAIEYGGEFICKKIGLRTAFVSEGIFYLNGRAVRLKGVTYCGSDPQSGSAFSADTIKNDIILMKRHNINTVFLKGMCDVRFTELCDRYGLYVIESAETDMKGLSDLSGAEDDPQWENAVTDRVKSMVQRDKNTACVILWSAGCFSKPGMNSKAAVRKIKELDDTRPVCCVYGESNVFQTGDNIQIKTENANTGTDFEIVTDLTPAQLRKAAEIFEKPVLLINSSCGEGGSIKDYPQEIYNFPRLAGMSVGVWRDTANENNEVIKKGFVTLGFKPRTSLKELKAAAKPLKVDMLSAGQGAFLFTNLMDFDYLSRFEITWELTRDGKKETDGYIGVLPIPPGRSERVDIPYTLPGSGRCFIHFSFREIGGSEAIPDGSETAFCQFELPCGEAPEKVAAADAKKPSARRISALPEVSETARFITISGKKFSYTFDKHTGNFSQLVFDKKELLKQPFEYTIFRKSTESDAAYFEPLWKKAGFDRMSPRVYETSFRDDIDDVVIHCESALTAAGVINSVYISTDFRVSAAGKISLVADTRVSDCAPCLPLFGVSFTPADDFNNFEFCGLGPFENYTDRDGCVRYGCFGGDTVKGRHLSDNAYLKSADGMSVNIRSRNDFGFTVIPSEKNENRVIIDYKQNAAGGGENIPPEQKYIFDEKKLTFSFTLEPIS